MTEEDFAIPSDERFAALARELIDTFDAWGDGEAEFGQRERRPAEGRFLGVWGLVAHTHRLGDAVLKMRDDGLSLETLPLIRLMYESALTAVWMAQNEEAAAAFVNKEKAALRATVTTMSRSANPTIRNAAAQGGFPILDSPPIETDSDRQAKVFEALCNDLTPGGADAYLYYRMLCRYSHASVFVAEQYLVPSESGDEVTAVLAQPRDGAEPNWSFFLVASIIWAGRALDYIDPARQRRSQLRRAAREVGIAADLHLTDAARRRVEWAAPCS